MGEIYTDGLFFQLVCSITITHRENATNEVAFPNVRTTCVIILGRELTIIHRCTPQIVNTFYSIETQHPTFIVNVISRGEFAEHVSCQMGCSIKITYREKDSQFPIRELSHSPCLPLLWRIQQRRVQNCLGVCKDERVTSLYSPNTDDMEGIYIDGVFCQSITDLLDNNHL